MVFNTDKPIFRQIVDLCHARIISGEWQPGAKIPSVREFAIELAVNARTVLGAFEKLEGEGVISSRRGLGFFLADDAEIKVREAMKADFFDNALPKMFGNMERLGISIDEIVEKWNNR